MVYFPLEFIVFPILLGTLLFCTVFGICTCYFSNRISENGYLVMYYRMRNNPPPLFVQPISSNAPPLKRPPPILILNPDDSIILGEKQ